MLPILQTQGKTLHHQKDYNSLYCITRFIAVVWPRTRNIAEVCLYFVLLVVTQPPTYQQS